MEASTKERSSTHRPDIEGLRAVAVLLVVATHLHIGTLTGGFIGVDVFFVISGYLISDIILRDIATGTFSLASFYERRIRRIFPALAVMLAATVPFAWHYFLPGEMATYARSLLAALFGVSNFIHWGWRGYFDQSNDLKPLLHTWSLGVEEQFYLLFPLTLLLLTRLRHSRRATAILIWSLTIASFAAACILIRRNPQSTFFMLPTRAWELLLGAILSQHHLPTPRTPLQRNIAATLGLALIFAPAFLYTAATPFPGLSALPPCLGATLILAAGETGSSFIGRILSLRPIAFIGLISYSLYLWHWPIQIFANFHHLATCAYPSCDAAEPLTLKLALFALSIAIATLSWRFVETPFRTGRLRPNRRQLFTTAGFASATIAATAIILLHGAPSRFNPQAVQAASYMQLDTGKLWRWNVCALALDSTAAFRPQTCLPYTPSHKHYLLVGDSHAAQLWPGLSTVFPGLEIGQANVAGCNLLPNRIDDESPTCRDLTRFLYRDLLPTHTVDTLIVSALWHDADIPSIANLITYARDHAINVILIGPNLSYDVPLPRLLATNPHTTQLHASPREAQLDNRIATLARDQWHVPYISIFQNLCPNDCPTYATPTAPMLLDTNHLTPEASILFAQTIQTHHQLP